MNTQTKKNLSTLLAVCLVFGLTPLMASPALAAMSVTDGNIIGFNETVYGSGTDKDGSAATAAFMVTAAVTPITPEMPVNPFADVFGTDWFIDAVIYVYDKGLMTGTSTDPMLFSPRTLTTRGMIVTVFYRMEGSPDVSGLENPFADVAEGAYYCDAVKWAYHNDILTGYVNGTFGPKDNVTREQLAAILLNYELYTGKIPPDILMDREFSDWDVIGGYAKNAVNRLTIQGMIRGKPGNLFDPKGEATRAETVTLLMRFMKALHA